MSKVYMCHWQHRDRENWYRSSTDTDSNQVSWLSHDTQVNIDSGHSSLCHNV